MRLSIIKLFALLAGILLLSFSSLSASDAVNVDWNRFSNDLVRAIHSDNPGVKFSAMQLAIKHADFVDISQARYEVMRIFMEHKDQKVRQLALVTLGKINNTFDMGFLERRLQFEDDPVIKKQITAVLANAGRLELPEGSVQIQFAGL